MRFIATTLCVGLSVVPALAQSMTSNGSRFGLHVVNGPAVEAVAKSNRDRVRRPGDVLPSDDPLGTERDLAGRPIRPDSK